MVEELTIIDPLLETDDQSLPEAIQLVTDPNHPDHWKNRKYGDPIKDDFRVFLTLFWAFLGLPRPTDLQLSIAWHLQHHGWSSEIDRQILMAFRGAAKSFITVAYVLWHLLRDPQLKIGIYSGGADLASATVNFLLNCIAEMPELKHLYPKPNQRQSSKAFDVGPARPDKNPSVFAKGITGNIVGSRADIIIGDDVETNKNSMTPDMREKLANSVREFDAIIKPGGQIIFLGTPQTEASIYNVLSKRGFETAIWPVRFPTGKQRRAYGARLAAYISWKLDRSPSLVGTSTEPGRFSDEDLVGREISWGKAGFALQYMLDTSLADVDKYPLRLRDFIVMSLDRRIGPDLVAWGSGEHLRLRDVQPISLDGDALYGPASVSESFSKWEVTKGFIDPSGRGADETTLTIGSVIHSTPFLRKQAGWQDGYAPETLQGIAELLVAYRVQTCKIEEDFGQGMFVQLLQPYVQAAWKAANKNLPRDQQGATELVSERAPKVQKELRILEVLEPIFQAHRLVVAKEVLEEDAAQVQRRDGTDLRDRYSLMYQLTRLTREKDCLTHDDRVEGVAGLLKEFLDLLGLHPGEQAAKRAEEDLEEELRKFDAEFDTVQGRSGAGRRVLRGNLRSGRARGH